MRPLWLLFIIFLPSSVWADLNAAQFGPYEGKLVTQITVTGNKRTKEYIITRELEMRVGMRFRLQTLKEDVQRLDNLMIFSLITVAPSDYENGVGLEIQVKELPWILPYIKFNYTEENGLSIGPSLATLNTFGRNIRLSGYVLLGGKTEYSLRFINPWIAGDHVSVEFVAKHLNRNNTLEEFKEVSDEVILSMGRYLGKQGRINGMISYFGVSSDIDGRTLEKDNQDDLFRLGMSLRYDSRDSYPNPHRGWQNELQLTQSIGSGNFLTYDIDVRRFQPITQRQTLLIGSLHTLQTGKVGVDIPKYMRFRMGGSNSIRGYDIDELGKVLFGKNQWIITSEYHLLLMDITEFELYKWSVSFGYEFALFADLGIAWSEDKEFARDRIKGGFGFGLRALVPGVNVIRLDVGFTPHGDAMFHLGVEPKFVAQRYRLR